MIKHFLQTATCKYLALLLLILSPFAILLRVMAQGRTQEQNQRSTHRANQFRTLKSLLPDPQPENGGYTKHELGYYLDPNEMAFVRPGLRFAIQNVTLGTDLKISVRYLITDDRGLPLDRLGIVTPGAVSTSFIAAYIPKGQSQYVAYTTRDQTSPITGQLGGPGCGRHGWHLPASGGRNVHLHFWTGTADQLRPDDDPHRRACMAGGLDRIRPGNTGFQRGLLLGSRRKSAVTVVRDVVRTETCNKCHDPLALHGGSRREVAALRHLPHTADHGSRHWKHLDIK